MSSQSQTRVVEVDSDAPRPMRSRLGRGKRQDPSGPKPRDCAAQGRPEGEGWPLLLTGACGAARHLEHLRGHKVDLRVVRGLHAPADPQHLPDGVLIAMTDLEVFPRLPESPSCLWRVEVVCMSWPTWLQILNTCPPAHLPRDLSLPGGRRSENRSCRWLGHGLFPQACIPCLQTSGTSPGHAHPTAPGRQPGHNEEA